MDCPTRSVCCDTAESCPARPPARVLHFFLIQPLSIYCDVGASAMKCLRHAPRGSPHGMYCTKLFLMAALCDIQPYSSRQTIPALQQSCGRPFHNLASRHVASTGPLRIHYVPLRLPTSVRRARYARHQQSCNVTYHTTAPVKQSLLYNSPADGPFIIWLAGISLRQGRSASTSFRSDSPSV
jgi:hypothetical protein